MINLERTTNANQNDLLSFLFAFLVYNYNNIYTFWYHSRIDLIGVLKMYSSILSRASGNFA